jgi:hypothetical protein
MIKTTIIRDKKGKILEVIEEGDIDEYIAFDEEIEGDPYE